MCRELGTHSEAARLCYCNHQHFNLSCRCMSMALHARKSLAIILTSNLLLFFAYVLVSWLVRQRVEELYRLEQLTATNLVYLQEWKYLSFTGLSLVFSIVIWVIYRKCIENKIELVGVCAAPIVLSLVLSKLV